MLGRPWALARARLRRIAADEYRRDKNARWADIDSTSWLLLAVALSALLACKPPNSTGLLLLGGCNVLLSLAMRQLIKRRRHAYIANRELLIVLGYAPALMFTARQQSVTGHLHRHGGNPLRLLGLLLLFHPGTWTLVGALIGGLTVAANQLILPAVALSAVWIGSGSTCQQLLEVPGVELPLMKLHWAADWMHTGLLLPRLFSGAARPTPPMQQCLTINAWLMGATGVLLPLFIIGRLEAAARRQFYVQRRQWGGESGEQHEPLLHDQQPMEWSSLYCSSVLVWLVADATYSLRLQTAH